MTLINCLDKRILLPERKEKCRLHRMTQRLTSLSLAFLTLRRFMYILHKTPFYFSIWKVWILFGLAPLELQYVYMYSILPRLGEKCTLLYLSLTIFPLQNKGGMEWLLLLGSDIYQLFFLAAPLLWIPSIRHKINGESCRPPPLSPFASLLPFLGINNSQACAVLL